MLIDLALRLHWSLSLLLELIYFKVAMALTCQEFFDSITDSIEIIR